MYTEKMENRPIQLKDVYNCRGITTRIALGEIGGSRWKERFILRSHLAFCWFCRRYERQLKIIGSALRLSVGQKLECEDLTSLKTKILHELPRS